MSLSQFARQKIVTVSAVMSHASLLILLQTQPESGCYSIWLSFTGFSPPPSSPRRRRCCSFISTTYSQPPSGQSRVVTLSVQAFAYRPRSLPTVRRHRASKYLVVIKVLYSSSSIQRLIPVHQQGVFIPSNQ